MFSLIDIEAHFFDQGRNMRPRLLTQQAGTFTKDAISEWKMGTDVKITELQLWKKLLIGSSMKLRVFVCDFEV